MEPAEGGVHAVEPVDLGGSVHECAECGDPLVSPCKQCDCCKRCCECADDEFDADELGLDPEQPYDYPEE